ncbi:MAG: peptide chain release factor-like protein, partial [Solirubrobacteraceae bacterium]
MPEPLEVNDEIEIPAAELTVRTSRSGGPGGQHANVTASRVEVSFDIATSPSLPEWARARLLERLGPEVSAVAQDERSQLRNRELALARLAARLAAALHRPR